MKKIIIITTFILATLVACNEDFCYELVPAGQQDVPQFVIGKQEAIGIANGFMNSFCSKSRSAVKHVKGIEPDVYAWQTQRIATLDSHWYGPLDSFPDTLLYVVNYGEGNGCVIVSADKRVPGILGYIEKENIQGGEKIENPGLKLFLAALEKYYLDAYEDYSEPYPFDSTLIKNPGESYVWMVDTLVSPLLSTEWGQKDPYNMFCPVVNDSVCLAGCVAIATSQILAYHQFPDNYAGHDYYWSQIMNASNVSPSDTIAAISVGHLVRDVGDLVFMQYGTKSSSAYSIDVTNCLNKLGYAYNRGYSLSIDTINNSLNNNRPIYISGSYYDKNARHHGHAWVIDGSAVLTEYQRQFTWQGVNLIPVTTHNLVHCNWGWNGLYNGFFVCGAFEQMADVSKHMFVQYPTGYDIGNYMYTNIHPLNK